MKVLSTVSLRKRILILVVLPLILLFALFRFAWLPITDARTEAANRITGYLTVIAAADAVGSNPVVASSPVDTRPLAARVTETAAPFGLPLRRLEPEGRRIRVTIDEADFITVLTWIAEMESSASLRLTGLEADRRPAPGVVSVRLVLEDAR